MYHKTLFFCFKRDNAVLLPYEISQIQKIKNAAKSNEDNNNFSKKNSKKASQVNIVLT